MENEIQEIKVKVKGGYLRAIPAEDPDYPGIWVEFIRDNEPDDVVSRPQILFEQPVDFAPGCARVLVWEDTNSEDYTKEIIWNNPTCGGFADFVNLLSKGGK